MNVTIEKHWDGNKGETEGVNGRIYTTRGRWQWVVLIGGVVESTHDTKRSAVAFVRDYEAKNDECPKCSRIGRGPLCKAHRYDSQPCGICQRGGRYTDCTTHPDAANPLAYCGDCGQVTCPDHRVDDDATRCVDCAATHYASKPTTTDTIQRFHCTNRGCKNHHVPVIRAEIGMRFLCMVCSGPMRWRDSVPAQPAAAAIRPTTTETVRRGRPPMADGTQKVQVSIRLDPDVADFLRGTGDGWSLRIGDILKAHMKRQQRQQRRRKAGKRRTR